MFTTKAAHGLAILSLSALATGCASRSPFDDFVARDFPRVDPAGAAVQPAPVDSAAAPTVSNLPLDLPPGATVDDFVRLALERNPSLVAARHRVEMMRARVPQATSLEDPMAMVAPVGQMAQTAAGEAMLMAGVSQELPWPGKLDARGKVAAAEVKVAEAELVERGLAVAAQVRRAYWNYYLAARTLEVVRESRDLLAQLQRTAEAAYAAGTAQQQDVLRAGVELSTLENELITLAEGQRGAAAQLNALLDRAVTAPLPEPMTAEPANAALRLDALLAQAAATNPELAATRQRIEAARQRLRLARLERIPDLTAGVQYVQVDDENERGPTSGDDQWWLQFSFNLPIWNGKYDAMQTEARQAALAELAELNATQNNLAAELQNGAIRVETQGRLVRLFRDSLIPQAQQALDASLSSYRAGNLGFGEVVDNWQKVIEFRRMLHASTAELQQELAELERLIGAPLAPAEEH